MIFIKGESLSLCRIFQVFENLKVDQMIRYFSYFKEMWIFSTLFYIWQFFVEVKDDQNNPELEKIDHHSPVHGIFKNQKRLSHAFRFLWIKSKHFLLYKTMQYNTKDGFFLHLKETLKRYFKKTSHIDRFTKNFYHFENFEWFEHTNSILNFWFCFYFIQKVTWSAYKKHWNTLLIGSIMNISYFSPWFPLLAHSIHPRWSVCFSLCWSISPILDPVLSDSVFIYRPCGLSISLSLNIWEIA